MATNPAQKQPNRPPFVVLLLAVALGVVISLLSRGRGVNFIWILSLIVATFIIVLPLAIRSAVLAQMDGNLRFPPAKAEDYPLLDQETVNRNVAELESLGFVHRRDFCVESSSPLVPPGFARSFIHPELNCIGEVNQMFPKNAKPMQVTCVIISYFGTGNLDLDEKQHAVAPPPLPDPSGELPPLPPLKGYMYSTHNRKLNRLMNMIRHERSFGTSLPDAGPQELLRVHLERRALVAEALGEPPDGGELDRVYFAFSSQIRQDMHRRIAGRNPWTMVYGSLLKGHIAPEWFGNLSIKQ